jgi:hypothetical protein
MWPSQYETIRDWMYGASVFAPLPNTGRRYMGEYRVLRPRYRCIGQGQPYPCVTSKCKVADGKLPLRFKDPCRGPTYDPCKQLSSMPLEAHLDQGFIARTLAL